VREVVGWEANIVAELGARGIANAEAIVARAMGLRQREGGAVATHLVGAGVPGPIALDSVGAAAGLAAIPRAAFETPRAIDVGVPAHLLWRALAAPVGQRDGAWVIAFADPSDAATAAHLGFPPHHAGLGLEVDIRRWLHATLGPAPQGDTRMAAGSGEHPTVTATPSSGLPMAAGVTAEAEDPDATAVLPTPVPPVMTADVVVGQAVPSAEGAPTPQASNAAPPSVRSAAAEPDAPERVLFLEEFALQEPVGEGGMATVFRAIEKATGRTVAVKMMLPHLAADEEYVERFRREARHSMAVHHENVVEVLGYGADGDQHFMVSEFVSGGTVAGLLKRMGAMPSALAAALTADVLKGLGAAHQRGLIHRDLKPGNLLLSEAGVLKIADFGIAKQTGDATLTATGSVLGTPAYMSPEQTRGEDLDGRSDLFAAGTILYELLTGRNPFSHEQFSVTFFRLAQMDFAPIYEACPVIPGSLESVAVALMQADRKNRPAKAEDALRLLAPLLEHIAKMEPELMRHALQDPDEVQRRLVRAHAAAELERGRKLLLQGAQRRSPAALAIYRASLTDPTWEEPAQLITQVTSTGEFYFGTPKNPKIAETLAALEKEGPQGGLYRRLSELYRSEGNIFQAVTYLKRYLALRPEDHYAATQLSTLTGDHDGAPFAAGATTILPLAMQDTKGVMAGIATGGWKAPAAPEEPLDEEPMPVVAGMQVLMEGDEPPTALDWARGAWNAFGTKLLVFLGIVAIFWIGMKMVGGFIDTSKEDIDTAFEKSDSMAQDQAALMAQQQLARQRQALVKAARTYRDQGSFRMADESYGQALGLSPPKQEAAQLYLERGKMRASRDEDYRAEKDLKKAIDLSARNSKTRIEAKAALATLQL
jgi:serine/threonine protein kinase